MSDDMSTARMEEILKESEEILKVFSDLVLEDGTEVRAQQAIQMLLVHAKNALLRAKELAIPHELPIDFLGVSLRYPKDNAAAYSKESLEEMKKSPDKWERDEAERYEKRLEFVKPLFLGDEIWNSSDNCSDQGFGLFSYNDFATTRGDY